MYYIYIAQKNYKETTMKRISKILTVLLALVMVLSVLASCSAPTDGGDGSSESKPESSSTPNQNPESTPSAESSKNDLTQFIPPPINLDREMTAFVGELYYDEWLDTDDGDLVGTELYNRVLRVEANLGIDLTVDRMMGDGPKRAEIIAEIIKRQESTDPNMIADLCSTYSNFAGQLTLEGRYQNINNSDNIDLENPWWPADLLESSAIDDKVYFVSGDISPTLIYETYAIFYNRTLVEKYNIEDPIALVNNYEWTLDKVIEVSSNIYEDLDQSSGVSIDDFIAFNFNDDAHMKSFPFAMGVRVLVPDEDNGFKLDPSYTGEKMETINDKMAAWITNNNGVTTRKETGVSNYGVSFKTENCIFTVGNFAYAAQNLAGTGIDYAVVPCPLYDTDQEDYYSYYGNPTSFWGIPTNADVDDSCALLESLGADGYVYISPALFERALKLKYVTNEVDGLSKMFDIIREGLTFDASMFYTVSGIIDFSALAGGLPSWKSTFTAFKVKAIEKSLKTVVDKLRALTH